ncbi:acylphosphatase [Ignisphaera aggregans DSM 17230]|uniref:Acylphosphatase n=1 Tax=Ignisphaera aggregans (strain DSM 17230 / JCM 13409 / AQ1.S1) TaxID=583356 RepID=E0STG2_IGNAA|nr:acylphosphatase [Ignisphaera aggregans DSM 17230]
MTVKRIEILIQGVLKGFGYIAYIYVIAKKLNLKGIAKFIDEDKIEVIAEGEEESLKEFIKYLENNPTAAIINSLEYRVIEPSNSFDDFIADF